MPPSAKRAKVEAAKLKVGDQLPSVDLHIQTGEVVNLAEKYQKGILVLFAYPRASTPGCTRQTNGFGEQYPHFLEHGAQVYGISADSEKAQTTFKAKTGVEFDLISDPNYELLGPLGAKKSPSGVLRSHWVFQNGKAVVIDNGVKPGDSPVDALEAVAKLSKEEEEEKDEKEEKEEKEKEEKEKEEKDKEEKDEDKKEEKDKEEKEDKEEDEKEEKNEKEEGNEEKDNEEEDKEEEDSGSESEFNESESGSEEESDQSFDGGDDSE